MIVIKRNDIVSRDVHKGRHPSPDLTKQQPGALLVSLKQRFYCEKQGAINRIRIHRVMHSILPHGISVSMNPLGPPP